VEVRSRPVDDLVVPKLHAQRHDSGVRDREREHRAERVHRPEEVRLTREDDGDRRDPGEDDEREPRGPEARVQAAEDLGELPIARHRIGDPGGADHAGVRGDEQDRGSEDADVDLERIQRQAVQVEVLHEPEDGIVRVAALFRRQPELGLVLAVDLRHGERGKRDQREREIDGEDGDRDEPDRARNVPRRVASLLREVRDGLDAGVGDHRHRNREEEGAPRRGDSPVHVVDEDARAEDEDEAEDDEQELRREVDDGEKDVQAGGLLDPDDVQPDEQQDHERAADDVPWVLAQRLPEDREVVRDEERRDGDRDHVVEELRPGGAEADELVERMAREARRAAGLGIENRPLRVRERCGREDQAGDDEDEGRQPEGEDRRDPERVVDRRADVAIRRREERGRPEDPLQSLLPSASPRRQTCRLLDLRARHGSRLSLRPAGGADLRRRSRALPGGRQAAERRASGEARQAAAPETFERRLRSEGGGPWGNQGFPHAISRGWRR
jgi:hypothetical protein